MTPFTFVVLSVALSTPPPAIPPVVVAPPPIALHVVPTPAEALYRGMTKLTPEEAVMKAAEAYPRPVVAVFELEVRRAEQVGPNFFLNSESDYRDPRNLSVRIEPLAMSELHKRLGNDFSRLLGRTLHIVGPAMRVRIDFIDNGRPTGKYYYQTQVPVRDARQLEVTDRP